LTFVGSSDGLNCSAAWRRVEEVEALQQFLSHDPEQGRPGPEARATGIARSWSAALSSLLAPRRASRAISPSLAHTRTAAANRSREVAEDAEAGGTGIASRRLASYTA
jgi:hypothetical protein